MSNYIIKYTTKVNGKKVEMYHESISSNKNATTINTYIEHITTDKNLAKTFFDQREAERIANVFCSEYHIGKVINLKN